MSFIIDPYRLQACIAESLENRGTKDDLFKRVCKRLFQEYAPYITRCQKISSHCVMFYTSLNELLFFFRNNKHHKPFITQFSSSCSTWDVLVKGRVRAEALTQVSPGAVYRWKDVNNPTKTGANQSVQWLRAGDMLQREAGTQSQVALDKDAWCVEYIRGYAPRIYGSSLYRQYNRYIYSYNTLPSAWQSCQTHCITLKNWIFGNLFWRKYGANCAGMIADAQQVSNLYTQV